MPKGFAYPEEVRQKAADLRRQGLTYTEIQSRLNNPIPKNTFTGWFKDIHLSKGAQRRIVEKVKISGGIGLAQAWQVSRDRRERIISETFGRVSREIVTIDLLTSKIILATLYQGEGKKKGGAVIFGNSDPKVITLFLFLLRRVFLLDENKLRGSINYRADQNLEELKKFWSEETGIPLSQFHKGQMDKRTLNKPTKRKDYKGVFVVIYCSTAIFLELKLISDIIYKRVCDRGL